MTNEPITFTLIVLEAPNSKSHIRHLTEHALRDVYYPKDGEDAEVFECDHNYDPEQVVAALAMREATRVFLTPFPFGSDTFPGTHKPYSVTLLDRNQTTLWCNYRPRMILNEHVHTAPTC